MPYVHWPMLCARCGTKRPAFYRSKVSEEEWDRYVQMDMRETSLCEPCYERIKKVVDERSHHEVEDGGQ